MIVLGLDLSISSTGIAICKDGRVLETTSVPTKSKDKWIHRIDTIWSVIFKWINTYQPDSVYIENYSYNSIFDRETLAELHGVVMWELEQLQIPYHKIPPTQVKQFGTGRGQAPKCPEGVAKSTWGKRWVVEAVNTRYDTSFKLSENDKADAFLISLLGFCVERAKETGRIPSLEDFQVKVVHNIINPSDKKKGEKKNGKNSTKSSRIK